MLIISQMIMCVKPREGVGGGGGGEVGYSLYTMRKQQITIQSLLFQYNSMFQQFMKRDSILSTST